MILIVDDSPESRFATRRALTRAGFETLEAATGGEGITLAARENPDLVVLDVNLPDLDGFEVCRILKADPLTAHLPVLQVSAARIDSAARVAGLEAGADAYLIEPIDPAVLVATVNALLRLRAAEDRLRRRVEEGETLRRLSAALADALTRVEVVSVLATQVLTELDARGFWLCLNDERTGALRIVEADDDRIEPADSLPAVGLTADDGVPRFWVPGDPLDGIGDPAPQHALAIVPLTAYGRLLGALGVGFADVTAFDEESRSLMLAIGERCGQALERAKLYEEQRHIATTLQEGLLPSELPVVPGVTLGIRYVSGTRDMQVGGDFYDVFARDDDWIAVIGDVCGRGAEAAALTSLARHTIRAHAAHVDAPQDILLRLDGAIHAELVEDRASFLTAACARLRLDAGTMRVTVAVAGHPPPLIARADGTIEPIVQHGPLLGMLEDIEMVQVEAELTPGDALVLYTDGVIEAPVGDADRFGIERLLAVVGPAATGHTHAQSIADAILAATGSQGDDIAVLVVGLAGATTPAEREGRSTVGPVASGR